MKTKKLYDQNAKTFTFTSEVLTAKKINSTTLSIELTETAFFPESGGQSADTGTLGSFAVIDTQIDEIGRITHICRVKEPNITMTLPKAGDILQGQVDRERRLEFMRHHTGEHMFSGLVHRGFGYHNVGFHLSDHICTMDYDGPLSPEDVSRLEEEVNALIQQNRPIRAYYPDETTLAQLDYRCKGELAPPIRIVEIEGVDVCACCAPHVPLTGEIGVFKILETKSYKGGIRLSIACGMKAFRILAAQTKLLSDAARRLSANFEDLPKRIDDLLDERYNLKQTNVHLQQELLATKVSQIPADAKDALLFVEEANDKAAREIINKQMTIRDGLCGIFIGNDHSNYRFILGSNTKDMQQLATRLRERFQAKCGGSKQMIQGQLSVTQKDLEELLLK